jgi:hypothetical protein
MNIRDYIHRLADEYKGLYQPWGGPEAPCVRSGASASLPSIFISATSSMNALVYIHRCIRRLIVIFISLNQRMNRRFL